VVAGISQAALLWWGARKSGARVDLRWPRLTPEIRRLLLQAVPGSIAASATQVNIFVSSMLVSQVNGARTWLAVCDRLYMLPQGLVGVAVGVALLPQLSRAVHAGDRDASQEVIDEAIVFSMALTLPAAAALLAMPFFLIDALYTRGAFTSFDAHATADALRQYAWGVPAFMLAQLFSRVFFASQDTKTPMRYALISVAVNVVAGISLFTLIGVPGIAAATSLAAWVNVLMMGAALARRGLYSPGAAAVSRLLRILAATLALGLLAGAASWNRDLLQGLLGGFHLGPLGQKEIAVVLACLIIMALYPALLFASGGLTIAQARAALRRRPKDPAAPVLDTPDLP